MPVDLLGNRPVADVEGVEALAQLQVFGLPGLEAFGRVIRGALEQRRSFEGAPVLEKHDEIVVSRCRRGTRHENEKGYTKRNCAL